MTRVYEYTTWLDSEEWKAKNAAAIAAGKSYKGTKFSVGIGTWGTRTFLVFAETKEDADGKKYPYLSGGFSDSDFEFFDDGSILWFLRSAWMGSTGFEWAPMYVSRSRDGGKTWSEPEIYADCGVLPRLCRLECGVTLLCYARPGMYIDVLDSNSGEKLQSVCLMDPKDRSNLANEKIGKPTWHQWDGQCGNPEIISIGRNSALLFYGDFYYPDEDGVKRKSILCRKITVEI